MKRFISFLMSIILVFGQFAAFAAEISPYKLNIEKLEQKKKNNEVPKGTFKKFRPYKVTIQNDLQNEYNFDFQNISIVLENGVKTFPVKKAALFKKSKGHPVVKALVVGVPVGAVTLGFLFVPTFLTTFALGVDANNTLKKELDKIYFDKKVLKSSEEFTFYIFIPKNTPDIKEIILEQS